MIRREFFGDRNLNAYDEISFSLLSVERFDTFMAESYFRSVSGCFVHGNFFFSENRDIHGFRYSENRFGRRDFDRIMEIRSLPDKSSLRVRNGEGDVEIAVSVFSFVSFVPHFDAHAVFDSLRHFDGLCDCFLGFSFPVATGTFFDNLFSGSVTTWTGFLLFHDTENRFDPCPYLSRSVASAARFSFSARSRAGRTDFFTREFYLAGNPSDRVFEGNLDLYLDVAPDLRSSACPPAVREPASEKFREYITHIDSFKSSRESPKSASSHIVGCAESVIVGAFLRIGEGRIGFVQFLEFGFFLFVSAVPVGVAFHCLFSVGFFDGCFVGRWGNSENVVVCVLAHIAENRAI